MARKKPSNKIRLSGFVEDRRACFTRIANDQRGRPEGAMHRIYKDSLSPLYGSLAEHVGDLTHRMAEYPDHTYFHNGFGAVEEKVRRTLRWLTNAYGFEREVRDNVRVAVDYNARNGTPMACRDFSGCMVELKRRGMDYANEHRKLKPCNAVQRIAKAAAIAVGEFRFEDAIDRLRSLQSIIDQGPDAWSREAGRLERK